VLVVDKEFIMRGSIRFVVGLLVTFGAVGGMESPEASLLLGTAVAVIGLGIMYSGVRAMKEQF
jgi:hypothetical protein